MKDKIIEVFKRRIHATKFHMMTMDSILDQKDRLAEDLADIAIAHLYSAGEEVWNKEAIELVRRHIPNNALAKDYILELLTRQPVSEGEITARELNSPSILAERAGKFAIWLDENRWFNYKNGKWHYTFEHGTAISMESYEKNYTKTHTELYKLFLKELLNR